MENLGAMSLTGKFRIWYNKRKKMVIDVVCLDNMNCAAYNLWLKNAPLETIYMLVLKDATGSPIPWYVTEGQDLKEEIRHFGKHRIITVFEIDARYKALSGSKNANSVY